MISSPFVFDWLRDWAEHTPDAPAVGTPAGWLTYRQLEERTSSLAASMAAHGLQPGERVLIALPNGPATVAASLAVQMGGGCAVELNRDWGITAMAAIAAQIEARQAVIDLRDALLWAPIVGALGISHLWVVHPSLPPERSWSALGDVPRDWLRDDGELPGAPLARLEPVRRRDAAALLVYTSGSTGAPRGVIQTHTNIAANTAAICEYLELSTMDRAMAILPLCYCYGKSVLQTHLKAGGSVFFDHRFMYPRLVLQAIAQQGCTGFAGVPLTFEVIRRQVDPRSVPMPSLRYLTQAGGAMSPDTTQWVREAFRPARLFVMYGQTEATARISYLPPERATAKAGSIGRPVRGVTLEVVDQEGRMLPAGQAGYLVARGDSVTPGYFRAPEETAEILRNGWLWTGDLGRKDEDGFFYLTGRVRDVLKIGGHRVNAAEIEERLCAHPDVIEAAVIARSDDAAGEAAVAFVVRRPASSVTEADLRRHCRERLPVYKVPAAIRFIDALPRTVVGKVAKVELRARLA